MPTAQSQSRHFYATNNYKLERGRCYITPATWLLYEVTREQSSMLVGEHNWSMQCQRGKLNEVNKHRKKCK